MGYHGEKEKESDGGWVRDGETSCLFAHGKIEVTSKSWLSLEAAWKKLLSHRTSPGVSCYPPNPSQKKQE